MDKEIFIVRHGETDYNKNGIIQGSGVNSSLNERGRQQAAAFFEYYKKEKFELVLVSDLIRTHESAAPFIQAGIPHEVIPEIREISWGVFEGQPYSPQVGKAYKNLIQAWAADDLSHALEGGESAEDLCARLSTFIDQLKTLPQKKILVFSHGRTIRCLMCLLKQLPMKAMEEFAHDNTGLFLVTMTNEGNRVTKLNDTSHLRNISLSN